MMEAALGQSAPVPVLVLPFSYRVISCKAPMLLPTAPQVGPDRAWKKAG
jgi:hypothetical protein